MTWRFRSGADNDVASRRYGTDRPVHDILAGYSSLVTHERKNQIKLAIERHLKGEPSDIESISLEELRDTHALLGDRDWNASYRIALRNRIKTLEENARRTRSRVRALQYALAILSTLLVGILLWQYFG